MKTCQPCKLVCDSSVLTCPACGEASWIDDEPATKRESIAPESRKKAPK